MTTPPWVLHPSSHSVPVAPRNAAPHLDLFTESSMDATARASPGFSERAFEGAHSTPTVCFGLPPPLAPAPAPTTVNASPTAAADATAAVAAATTTASFDLASLVAPAPAPATATATAIGVEPSRLHDAHLPGHQWSNSGQAPEQLLASLMQSTLGSGPPAVSWWDNSITSAAFAQPLVDDWPHVASASAGSSLTISSSSSYRSGNGLPLVGSRIKPFIARLHSMLADPDHFMDCLCWDDEGLCFIVAHTTPRLFDEVLPTAFGHRNLHSFTRQLNIYGFRRCTTAELRDKLDVA